MDNNNQGYGNNQDYNNSQSYGNNQDYSNNQSYGNNQDYSNNQSYGNNQDYSNNQGYGNNQNFSNNQSYANNQDYSYNQNYGNNQNFNNNPNYNIPNYNIQNTPFIPEEYRPISMWGYVGYMLVFSLPIAGLISLIIFAFGGTKNINLRNFARSYFCWALIGIIISAIIIIFAVALAVSMESYSYY